MEMFYLLAVVVGGGALYTLSSGNDDGHDSEPEPEPPEPEPPEPETVALTKGDGNYTGTSDDEIINAGDGYIGGIETGDGADLVTADGGDVARELGPTTDPIWRDSDGIDVTGSFGDTIVGIGKGVGLDGTGNVLVDAGQLDQGIVRLSEDTRYILPTSAQAEVYWDVLDDGSIDLSDYAAKGYVFAANNVGIIGSAQDDELYTSGTLTEIAGGDGNDRIDGAFNRFEDSPAQTVPWQRTLSDGSNELDGGNGDDTISADWADTVTGGEGADRIDFSIVQDSISQSGHVTDYDPDEDVLTLTMQGSLNPEDVTIAEVDGNTVISVAGQEHLVIEGRTGLSFGINLEETGNQIGNDAGYVGLDGETVDPATVNILIERYTEVG